MRIGRSVFLLRILELFLICCVTVTILRAQDARQTTPRFPISAADADHIRERSKWFLRGRLVHGKNSAELRRRAYAGKLKMRTQRAAALAAGAAKTMPVHGTSLSSGS